MKTRVQIPRFLSILALVGLALTMAISAPLLGQSTVAAKGGNSANAKLCQNGGWQNLQNSDGTYFSSEEECVASGAQGNGVAAPVPSITISFSFSGGGYCTGYAYLTGFAKNISYPYEWSFTYPNGSSSPTYSGSLWTNDQGTASLGSWFPLFLDDVSTLTVTVGGVTAGPVTARC